MNDTTHLQIDDRATSIDAGGDAMTKRRDELVRTFRAHVAVFAATMVVIFVVNLLTNVAAGIAGDLEAWWSIWALIGWSAALTVHGLLLRAELSGDSSEHHHTSG